MWGGGGGRRLWCLIDNLQSLIKNMIKRIGTQFNFYYPSGLSCVHEIDHVSISSVGVRYGGFVAEGFTFGSRWAFWEDEFLGLFF